MSVDPNKLSILHYPHPALRAKADPIEAVTDEVRAVAERMMELMAEAEGIGLAAPQVGLAWRMFVTAQHEAEPARVYINPVLTVDVPEVEPADEGCLSLPDIRVEVRRPIAITITALDEQGESFTLSNDAMLARVWQHETDHLDGVLIIDRMGAMDRIANRKLIKQLEKTAAG